MTQRSPYLVPTLTDIPRATRPISLIINSLLTDKAVFNTYLKSSQDYEYHLSLSQINYTLHCPSGLWLQASVTAHNWALKHPRSETNCRATNKAEENLVCSKIKHLFLINTSELFSSASHQLRKWTQTTERLDELKSPSLPESHQHTSADEMD